MFVCINVRMHNLNCWILENSLALSLYEVQQCIKISHIIYYHIRINAIVGNGNRIIRCLGMSKIMF